MKLTKKTQSTCKGVGCPKKTKGEYCDNCLPIQSTGERKKLWICHFGVSHEEGCPHVSQPVPTDGWEERFDKEFMSENQSELYKVAASLLNNYSIGAGSKKVKAFIATELALAKQSVAEEIYQEIEDSSFEVLFAKYLEHDDAVMAAEEIRKMVKSKYITQSKKEGE